MISTTNPPVPAPVAATGRREPTHWSLAFDEALTMGFVVFLLAATFATDGPTLQNLDATRLTFITVGALFVLMPIVLWRRGTDASDRTLARLARSWWPLLAGFFCYETLKHLHANRISMALGIDPKDDWMIAADRMLFGAVLPQRMEWMIHDSVTATLQIAYTYGYYLMPVVVLGGLYLFKADESAFLRVRRSMMATLFGGYVLYLLVPVAGPQFTMGDAFERDIPNHIAVMKYAFDTLRYNWDCFPSLHTAVPWVLTLGAAPYVGRAATVSMALVSLTVTLSTLYLRFHYGIDVIAGVGWAVIVHVATRGAHSEIQLRVPSFLIWKPLRWRLATMAGLFVATGLTALLAEQIFEKLLSTIVGASTPAGAIVLGVYFLGLGLGGWLYSVLGGRVRRPLQLYGVLELFIGAWALMLYAVLPHVHAMSSAVIRLGGDSEALTFLLRILISCAWILPPTTAMGATFPAVVGALHHMRAPSIQRLMTRFYAFNLLGAVAGAALGPYIFFPRLGLTGTLLLVIAIELIVFLVVGGIATGPRLRLRSFIPPKQGLRGAWFDSFARLARTADGRLLLLVAASSGFIAFGFEVLWIHLVGGVLGTSVYAFANMLAVVLGGLFIGGLITSLAFSGRRAVPVWVLPGTMLLSAWLLNLTFAGWDDVPLFLARWGAGLTTFADGERLRLIVAAGLIGLPAIVMGTVYPLIFRVRWFPSQDADRTAGALGAVNSAGSLLGALTTGFLLLPRLGSEGAYGLLTIVLAVLALGIGAFEWWRTRDAAAPRRHGRTALAAVCVAALALASGIGRHEAWNPLALTSGINVYFRLGHVFPDASTLAYWHEDSYGGFTTLVDNPPNSRSQGRAYRTLLTNGKFQANDSWEIPAQVGFALIPILHQPARDRALIIGLGSGNTAAIVRGAGFGELDVAEISPGIIEAARFGFPELNARVLEQANVHLHVEDGRNYLLRSRHQYDLITIEVSSIWFAGSSNIYSQEFYELARSHMTETGIFQQWIQLHHISPIEVASAMATLRSVFPHVSMWMMGGQAIMIASPAPLQLRDSILADLSESPEMAHTRNLMAAWGLAFDSVSDHLLLNETEVTTATADALGSGIPVNTDRNRFLEYRTPRYNLEPVRHVDRVLAALLRFVPDDERPNRMVKLGLAVDPSLASARH